VTKLTKAQAAVLERLAAGDTLNYCPYIGRLDPGGYRWRGGGRQVLPATMEKLEESRLVTNPRREIGLCTAYPIELTDAGRAWLASQGEDAP
jgi:hypothetical protein